MDKYVGRGCQIEQLWLNGSTGRFCWCADIQKCFYKCTYMFSRVTNELLNLIYLFKSLLLLLIYYFSFLNLSFSAAGTTRFICFIITAHKMKFSNVFVHCQVGCWNKYVFLIKSSEFLIADIFQKILSQA